MIKTKSVDDPLAMERYKSDAQAFIFLGSHQSQRGIPSLGF